MYLAAAGWQTRAMADGVFDEMVEITRSLQERICGEIEVLDDSGEFVSTRWDHEGGGGGHSRVLQGGSVFEKAGVNVSAIGGPVPSALSDALPGEGDRFRATGISLVLHPRSPMVPTTHANYRRLERGDDGWFGGGADLTPHYLFEEDARHFHKVHRDLCDSHPEVADYRRWKQACDEYFHLPHRGEHRGVGGIFFDRCSGDDRAWLGFVAAAGQAFLDAYVPIVRRRLDEPYGDAERTHQLVRRGRYVEFNLLYDRGTVFGLRSGGRVESILMSLPDPVRWVSDFPVVEGSWEARTLDALVNPRDWV